jgi:membrane fusion protein, copper/silver efflux system
MKENCRYDKAAWTSALERKRDILLGLLIVLFSACNEPEKKVETVTETPHTYYCPMHPDVMQDHPGKCPKPECQGMDLVLKITGAFDMVLEPVNASVLGSVKTINPIYKSMPADLVLKGYIDYDDRTKNNVSSLVSGRIEKLYVKYNYQPIRKGQKLFEIYSPELVTAQENLLYLMSNDPGQKGLIENAEQKLSLLGFTPEMLSILKKEKKPRRTVPVYSSYNGHAHAGSSDMQRSEMKAGAGELPVKEGQYIMMGETVFTIVSNENLAVVLQVEPENISKLSNNAEVVVTSEDGKTLKGKIDFIDPVLKPGAKTLTAKVYFNNSDLQLKAGGFVTALVKGEDVEALWVPVSAILGLGKDNIAWLKNGTRFTAKRVEVGLHSGNMVEIADGLTEADVIAAEAHYMIDSEGFININSTEKSE